MEKKSFNSMVLDNQDNLNANINNKEPYKNSNNYNERNKNDNTINKNISETQEKKFKLKRVKLINESDGTNKEISIIIQNENGPCPLIAIINTIILSYNETENPFNDLDASLKEISLNFLIEKLANLLLLRREKEENLLNSNENFIENLLPNLSKLYYGLNVNPRFDGTFEDSSELTVFNAFDIDLVHGWVADDSNLNEYEAIREARSYEGTQNIIIQSQELKLKNWKDLSIDEKNLIKRTNLIETFLEKTSTQLTQTGLNFISEILSNGSYAVLFRNNHFTTLYKHALSGQLFMLVTDLGYLNNSEIVWESLSDVKGAQSSFYSASFDPQEFISQSDSLPDKLNSKNTQVNSLINPQSTNAHTNNNSIHNNNQDYEIAKQLQQKEDEDYAKEQQKAYDKEHFTRIQKEKETRDRIQRKERRSNSNAAYSLNGNTNISSNGNTSASLSGNTNTTRNPNINPSVTRSNSRYRSNMNSKQSQNCNIM